MQGEVLAHDIFQYVIGPLLLAAVGAIGWLTRSYLHAIRHQVENDHETNLRSDVDRIIKAVDKHDENDSTLANAIASLTASVDRIENYSHLHTKKLERLEDRFDQHLLHHNTV